MYTGIVFLYFNLLIFLFPKKMYSEDESLCRVFLSISFQFLLFMYIIRGLKIL